MSKENGKGTPQERFLNAREQIIVRNAWAITRAERDKLDGFFLVKQNWEDLVDLFVYDDVEMKRILRWEGKEYDVVCLQPVRTLKSVPLLGLSFRIHRPTNIRVVLIREWIQTEEVDSIKEEGATSG